MVEILRYIIFFYCFLGVFISGGLFFNKRTPAGVTLAIFVFLFALEQLDYLYTTTDIVLQYPLYFLFIYPVCLLFGPALWLHFKYTRLPESTFRVWELLHGLPFVLFLLIFMTPLYSLSGVDRLEFTNANFMNHMMPLNYIRTTHVTFYGLWMVILLWKEKLYFQGPKGIYLSSVALIYFFTAVIQQYLTIFADSFRQFAVYFFLASTIMVIAGYVLFTHPELLDRLHRKYFRSGMKNEDRKRIVKKIISLEFESHLYLDNAFNLERLCQQMGEKRHFVSQVFSEDLNTSFSQFINKLRVEHARSMLLDPAYDDLKILAVAYESGFNNTVTFNKAFTKITGKTPGKFRLERALKS